MMGGDRDVTCAVGLPETSVGSARYVVAAQEWVPPGVDVSRPSSARVYDCFLGGMDNFAVDREVAARSLQLMPDAIRAVFATRAFLRRTVRYLMTEAGIDQFLDIGSGLPSRGHVHQVAHEINPHARVVYIDNDPTVLAHAQGLLGDDPTTAMVKADIRRPETILAHPTVTQFLDFERPAGLLMLSILHHINDDQDPAGIVACFREALVPGSHLAISHFHNPGAERPDAAAIAAASEKLFNESFGTGRWRHREEVLAYFGDFQLIEPGLVSLPEWRPDPETSRQQDLGHHLSVGGVAHKN